MSTPEPEITALSKFSCPACGARAEWNPAKRALICPYCGTESPADLKSDGSLVEEHDLVQALRSYTRMGADWAAEKKTVRCQSCQAISVFDATRAAQNCDFCGSPALLALEDVGTAIQPGALLPFVVAESTVREQIRKWYGSHFWGPRALGSKAMTDQLHGVYVPYWTFDAHVDCPWRAEAGYHYYVRNSQGNMERRTRWQSVSGRIQHFFDDMLTYGSRGVHPKLLVGIEPFPTTTDLVPYDPGYLTGWVVERYQIDLVDAAEHAKTQMMQRLREMCARQVPGDTHRGLRIDPQFEHQTFKHVLVPVWLLSYQYRSRTYQVAVNGATGKISGEWPISWVKVAIAVLIGLVILGLILANMES